MPDDIEFLQTLTALLQSLKEMVEVQAQQKMLSEWTREAIRELIEAIDDYTEIIKSQWYNFSFWDYVISDNWCRSWYYAFPDNAKRIDVMDDDDEGDDDDEY